VHPKATRAAALAALVWAASAALAPTAGAWSPAVNYAIHCQGCHMADGAATPGLVPPLAGVIGDLARVPEGRMYLVRLPNVASTPLSEQEAAELMTWVVRRFAAAGSGAEIPAFTPEEIERGRRALLIDIEAARRAVIAAIAASTVAPPAEMVGTR
jgi:mono/diheme cytochrome c family protein